ncbi:MAG: hypothetical protein ACREQI_16255 [Candidatus Binataceae bacterium]
MPPQTENSVGLPPHRKLPVLKLAAEAIAMPARYFRELACFGWVPLLIALGVRSIQMAVQRLGWEWVGRIPHSFWTVAEGMILFIVITPLAVAWTRIAIDGPESAARAKSFSYGHVERRYLGASLLYLIVLAAAIAVPLGVNIHARRIGDPYLMKESGALIVAALVFVMIAAIRVVFIFPAMATGRNWSLAAAWEQSRGYFESLLALDAIVWLPSLFLREIDARLFESITSGLGIALLDTVDVALVLIGWVMSAGAIALAYKFLVLGEPDVAAPPPAESTAGR